MGNKSPPYLRKSICILNFTSQNNSCHFNKLWKSPQNECQAVREDQARQEQGYALDRFSFWLCGLTCI